MAPTELQSRQHLIKAIVRCIAIFDLIHMVFPIILFCNLSFFGALILFGNHTHAEILNGTLSPESLSQENGARIVLYTTPISLVGIIAFSYGLIVAIRLFRSTHPEIKPRKSADMAMWWFHYSIILVVMEKLASAFYFYLGELEDDFVGEIFSFATNFSTAMRIVCIFVVRKYIRVMRKRDFELETLDATVASKKTESESEVEGRRSVKWQLPKPQSPLESPSVKTPSTASAMEDRREYLMRQNLFQMMFITKLLIVVDLMQNTFAVFTLIVLVISYLKAVANTQKVTHEEYVEFYGTSTGAIFYCVAMLAVFAWALYTGVKFLSETDKFANNQLLEELSESLQTRLIRIVRNWRIGCFTCVLLYEILCIVLMIVFGTANALILTAGLSFSLSIRAVSLYLVTRFKVNFFRKTYTGGGESNAETVPVPVNPKTRNKIVPEKLVGVPLTRAKETNSVQEEKSTELEQTETSSVSSATKVAEIPKTPSEMIDEIFKLSL